MKKDINRRDFLKTLGLGTVVATGLLASCKKQSNDDDVRDDYTKQIEPPTDKMTYRQFLPNKDKVSILGYGMMRLPTKLEEQGENPDAPKEMIDQEQVNKLVDYALEHGVNYYDTSPVYCQGLSERSTGIALKRHPRESYYVATKLSNFSPAAQTREGAIEMYRNSFKELQVDYIDYYLLHAIGGSGVPEFNQRYMDNGILDFLLAERKAGRIRNLGFSYHGAVEVFDEALKMHDKMKNETGETLWDFIQIELNYLDWEYANEINKRNTDAKYLYDECWKRKIPSVVMEPLLGGRLANLPNYIVKQLKQKEPEKSVASWAFRFAGTPEGVLTVLSGMTYIEHLKDNLLSYTPLKPLSDEENQFLLKIAGDVYNLENIPCTGCQYCMPCPYGIDIPGIFQYYNKCKNEATLPNNKQSDEYKKLRRQFLIGLDRKVPKLRQADHCIGCHKCQDHCPQSIRIAREMEKISQFVEELKRSR